MHSLDISMIADWTIIAKRHCPRSVNMNCPYCSNLAIFTFKDNYYDRPRRTMSSSGKCPACGKTACFWTIRPGDGNDSGQKGCACLLVFPPPPQLREPIEGLDVMSPRLRKAYQEILSVFNHGLSGPTGTLCRRLLEGILADRLPPDQRRGGLAKQIKKLADLPNLAQPILDLSKVVKDGGDICTHFDDEKDPDKDMTEAMLALVEYLLEYLYILPQRIATLEKQVNAPNSGAEQSAG